MRLRHIKNSENIIYNSNYVLDDKNFEYKKNNIILELGMGKGSFIIKNAYEYKDYNFIGIEKYPTVIMKAIENIEKYKAIYNYDFYNLDFLCIDIDKICDYFKENTINKIYINFSDPWPKKRHASRRLMHINFLNKYYDILKPNSIIEFKTDNKDLFDFSLEEIEKSKFILLNKTYDLHNDNDLVKNNIMTEYEEKFTKKNIPICKLIIKKLD